MPIKLNSAGGGSVTLDPVSTASTYTVSIPASNGSLVTTTSGSTVQFGAGSAGAPSITSVTDTTTGTFFPAASTVAISTAGSEKMRVTSAGNVGIGNTSPSYPLDVNGTIRLGATRPQVILQDTSATGNNTFSAIYGYDSAGTTQYFMGKSSAGTAEVSLVNFISGGSLGVVQTGVGFIYFATQGLERARFDGNGNFIVNSTTANPDGAIHSSGAGGRRPIGCEVTTTSSFENISFRNPNGIVGTISTSGSTTTYNSASDYRLKENIQPMQNALAKVALLNPVTYTWKVDGADGQGFIAHELQAVVPDCVTGSKDAVDVDGNPVYQGVDTSFLVATLTKAIQELKAELDSAKERISALEAQ